MGKKQWANETKKKMTRNFDAKYLDPIQAQFTLLQRPKIRAVREKEVVNSKFTTKHHNHIPDFTLNEKIYLEHDKLKTHGELGYEDDKTFARNCDYFRAEKPYYVIHHELASEFKLDEPNLACALFEVIQKIEDCCKDWSLNRTGFYSYLHFQFVSYYNMIEENEK